MAPVRRLVIDVLKPHEPPMIEFTTKLSGIDAVDGVNATLVELDREVQNVKLTFEGDGLELDAIETEIEHLGGAVHSVDQVVCGDHVVEDRPTLQDR